MTEFSHQWKGSWRSFSPTEVPRGAGASWGFLGPQASRRFFPLGGAGLFQLWSSQMSPWMETRCCCCWPRGVQDKGWAWSAAAELGALLRVPLLREPGRAKRVHPTDPGRQWRGKPFRGSGAGSIRPARAVPVRVASSAVALQLPPDWESQLCFYDRLSDNCAPRLPPPTPQGRRPHSSAQSANGRKLTPVWNQDSRFQPNSLPKDLCALHTGPLMARRGQTPCVPGQDQEPSKALQVCRRDLLWEQMMMGT